MKHHRDSSAGSAGSRGLGSSGSVDSADSVGSLGSVRQSVSGFSLFSPILCILLHLFASKLVESYGKEEVMLWKAAISWPTLRCISRVVATKVLSLDGASTDAQRPS